MDFFLVRPLRTTFEYSAMHSFQMFAPAFLVLFFLVICPIKEKCSL